MKEFGLMLLKSMIGIILFLGGHFFHGDLWGTIITYLLGFIVMDIWHNIKKRS